MQTKLFPANDIINGAASIHPAPLATKSNYLLDTVNDQHLQQPSGQIFLTLNSRYLIDPTGWSH